METCTTSDTPLATWYRMRKAKVLWGSIRGKKFAMSRNALCGLSMFQPNIGRPPYKMSLIRTVFTMKEPPPKTEGMEANVRMQRDPQGETMTKTLMETLESNAKSVDT